MRPLIAFLCFVLAVSYAAVIPSGKEVIYDYSTIVTVGTREPEIFASRFHIQCKLHLQNLGEQKLGVRLMDVKFRINNGKVVPEHDEIYLPMPADADALTKSFVIQYDGTGKVVNLVTDNLDKDWSINIKQAIASVLQLDKTVLSTPATGVSHVAVVPEETINGVCDVIYNILPRGDTIILRKSLNNKQCHGVHILGEPRGMNADDLLTTTSNRMYTLVRKDDHLQIQTIKSAGDIVFAPLRGQTSVQVVRVLQKFIMIDTVDIQERIHLDTERVIKGLKYINPVGECVETTELDSVDITSGRAPLQMDQIMPIVHKLLDQLVVFLDANQITLKREDVKNTQTMNRLLILLHRFDLPSLEHCFALMYEKKDDPVENRKLNIFLQMLPQAGTKSVAIFIRNLIRKDKISKTMAVRLVQEIPMHIRCPNEKLLIELENWINHVPDMSCPLYRAGVLSFASLVKKTYKSTTVKSDQLEKYINLYVTKLREATTVESKQLYLAGLFNIEIGSVVKHLEPILTGEEKATEQIRSLTLWAVLSRLRHDHMLMLKYVLPILADRTLGTELRITAYQIFVKIEDHIERYMDLYWLMHMETNELVYSFHYATLKSLANTKTEVLRKKAEIARLLLRISRKPIQESETHGIYISDFMDDKLLVGGVIENIVMRTDNVNSFTTKVVAVVNGVPVNLFSAFVKVRGLSTMHYDLVKKHMLDHTISTDKTNSVLDKITKESQEEFHVEVILLKNYRTIMTHYFDKSNIKNIVKLFVDVELMTKDINENVLGIMYPIQFERVIPNDFGVPVIFYHRLPVIPSLRFKLQHDKMDGAGFKVHVDLKLQVVVNGCLGLTVYNPINDIYHGIVKTKNLAISVPLNFDVILNAGKTFSINLVLKKDKPEHIFGLQTHVETNVYIFGKNGKDILSKFSTANTIERVTKGDAYRQTTAVVDREIYDLGKKLQITLYDCEKSISVGTVASRLRALTTGIIEDGLHTSLISSSVITSIKMYERLLTGSGYGSCGLGIRLIPSEEIPIDRIDLKMQVDRDLSIERDTKVLLNPEKLQWKGVTTFIGTDDKVERTWDMKALLELGVGYLDNKFTMRLLKVVPEKVDFKIDLDVHQKFVSDELTAKIKLIVGEVNNLGEIDVDLKGVQSEEQKLIQTQTDFTYDECKQEISLAKTLLPVSLQCGLKASTLRKYIADVTISDITNPYINNLRESRMKLFSRYLPLFKRETKGTQQGITLNEHIELVYPILRDEVDIVMESPVTKVTINGIPRKSHPLWTVLTPYNVHFPRIIRQLLRAGQMKTCVADYNTVLTETNRIVPYTVSQDWQLYAGDVVDNPNVAIYIKKVDGVRPLALRIKIEDDVLEIVPNVNECVFTVNGKTMSVAKTGYHVESFFNYMIVPNPKMVLLSTHKYGLFIEFDGHTARMHFAKPTAVTSVGKCFI